MRSANGRGAGDRDAVCVRGGRHGHRPEVVARAQQARGEGAVPPPTQKSPAPQCTAHTEAQLTQASTQSWTL